MMSASAQSAGSVVIVNSSLWHSGTRNEDGSRRRVLHLTYTRRDLPQQLTQRDYLTEALYERMSPAHRFLLDAQALLEADVRVARQRRHDGTFLHDRDEGLAQEGHQRQRRDQHSDGGADSDPGVRQAPVQRRAVRSAG